MSNSKCPACLFSVKGREAEIVGAPVGALTPRRSGHPTVGAPGGAPATGPRQSEAGHPNGGNRIGGGRFVETAPFDIGNDIGNLHRHVSYGIGNCIGNCIDNCIGDVIWGEDRSRSPAVPDDRHGSWGDTSQPIRKSRGVFGDPFPTNNRVTSNGSAFRENQNRHGLSSQLFNVNSRRAASGAAVGSAPRHSDDPHRWENAKAQQGWSNRSGGVRPTWDGGIADSDCGSHNAPSGVRQNAWRGDRAPPPAVFGDRQSSFRAESHPRSQGSFGGPFSTTNRTHLDGVTFCEDRNRHHPAEHGQEQKSSTVSDPKIQSLVDCNAKLRSQGSGCGRFHFVSLAVGGS